MDAERFENPRGLNKPMPNDAVSQKTSPSIHDRFKAMLKEREEDLRLSDDEDVQPPSTEEIVRLYDLLLLELTFNSKPIITDLTIIAGEQRQHGEGIADAICGRIIEVPVEQKLPSLYLLDSIVKNIGREYVRHFSARLPMVFCEAYRQVNPNSHPALRHLFGTWSSVFPPSVLHKIEAQLQFSPSGSHQSSGLRTTESPRPAHGIHVNPKYLEARRPVEHSSIDTKIQQARGASALKIHGQKSATGFIEYDSDSAEVVSSCMGPQRLSATGVAGQTSFSLGSEKVPSSSVARAIKQSSSFRTAHVRSSSPAVDEFLMNNSPKRGFERSSPSDSGFDFGLGRKTGRDERSIDWRRNPLSADSHRRLSAYATNNYNNGVDLQGPRALIDAYGIDDGQKVKKNRALKIGSLDANGLDTKVAMTTWQNTEEEEFDWEDMSPTLADHSQNNELIMSSVPAFGSSTTRLGFKTFHGTPVDTEFHRNNWPNQAQGRTLNDFSVSEDAVPTGGSGCGSYNSVSRIANETLQYIPQSTKLHNDAKDHRANLQMQFPAKRKSAIAGLESANPEVLPPSIPASAGAWHSVNTHKSQPVPLVYTVPPQKQIRNQFGSMIASNTLANQGLLKPLLHEQLDANETKVTGKLPQISSQQAPPIPMNQPTAALATLQPQLFTPHIVRQNIVHPLAISLAPNLGVTPLNHGYLMQGHNAVSSTAVSNSISGVPSLVSPLNLPNNAALPPLPPVPHPSSSQMLPIAQNQCSVTSSPLSSLLNSLMAQGFLNPLGKQAPVQDSVGVEFNPDLLKVRHESAITALYADLPRQCTTCGLRFKCQEEHSSHMDWHVTKNRISKNRKQKPSRRWFVSVNMWLSGAEALGTDSVPGFLPTENVEEKKDDEEMAVPADEDQNVCALCGEPFEDFYSDETEEWMYKGAVYMNAPDGSTAGMERSQLGPIVHAKCRSESSTAASTDFGQDRGG